MEDPVQGGDDEASSPAAGGQHRGRFTRRGTPRKRRAYRPRRDKGRFKLTPRDEWGMRYVADMRALRFDQLMDMFALWHYQQDLLLYEQQLADSQQYPQGPYPQLPLLQPQATSNVHRIINR